MHATVAGQLKVVKLLISFGCKLNLSNADLQSACHLATIYGHHDILRYLLKSNANWRCRDHRDRTPLHLATANDSSACLNLLLSDCTDDDLNEQDSEAMTPLHWAVFYNKPLYFQMMIKKRSPNLSISDMEGKTVLHWAATHRERPRENMSMSPTFGSLIIKSFPHIINLKDLESRTALHLACVSNNHILVSALAEHPNCDVNISDSLYRTPLHWAAVSGHALLVTILLQNGADDSLTDNTGSTPLHYACSKNHSQCVISLLDPSINPKRSYLPDSEGRYPLLWSISKGHVQTCRILLEKKVDPIAADSHGSTGK